jgi:endonuclease YncB( thermonuclease family)
MENFFAFLKKNMINLLIVGVVVLLVVVFAVDVYFVMTPSVRQNLMANIFPTPTFNLQQLVTRAALTAEANATPTPEPTITTMYFTPQVTVEAPTTEVPLPTTETTTIPPTQTPTRAVPTAAAPTATRQATVPAATPLSGDMACIPSNPAQKGKVLDIVDGSTIKVMINGLTYTVRYIGVAVPSDKGYARAAAFDNGNLVFAKDVTLVPDVTDKDTAGRLLRYVTRGDTFVNLEMIRRGLGSAADMPPNSACAQTFSAAEQAARASQVGQWAPGGAVPTP